MTHAQRQSIHASLEHYGRIAACDLAHLTNYPLDVVYEVLVSLESRELARVEISYDQTLRGGRVCEWVAA